MDEETNHTVRHMTRGEVNASILMTLERIEVRLAQLERIADLLAAHYGSK